MGINKGKHDHKTCEHILQFCEPCNEAYCTKCDVTFRSEPCMEQHYPWTSSTWVCGRQHVNDYATVTVDDGTSTTVIPDVISITPLTGDNIPEIVVNNDLSPEDFTHTAPPIGHTHSQIGDVVFDLSGENNVGA